MIRLVPTTPRRHTAARRFGHTSVWLLAALLALVTEVIAQQPAPKVRAFPPGALERIESLPASRLRTQIEGLPPAAQQRALHWLRKFHFTEADLPSLHAGQDGSICYACAASRADFSAPQATEAAVGAAAAVPVTPFPPSLIFHSRPGSSNVLFINFSGETVTGTAWNTSLSRASIPAVPFDLDTNLTMFGDSEQAAIKQIWQRMSEDYAPFDIDVTTERPATFTIRTAHALITRDTDANGANNPFSGQGGVGYVDVFTRPDYATYRPVWVYQNNFGNSPHRIAESASHEVGHNLGLSHDGNNISEYYAGHGSGEIWWGALMGGAYNANITQWSKGEYLNATNPEDDLAIINSKIAYRPDDHGDTVLTASPVVITGGTNVVATTPETDPANSNLANKGVIGRNTDLDVFYFVTGTGFVNLGVLPWVSPAGSRGGNLDVRLELHNDAGVVLNTINPASLTAASFATNLPAGRYFLHIRNTGTGNPSNATPSGYTSYGSLGQYFINGFVTAAPGFILPPIPVFAATDLTQTGQSAKQFTVTYHDNVAINVATIDSNDIRVTGPNGFDQAAQFISLNTPGNGTPRTATYSIAPPSGAVWAFTHNGTYTVWLKTNQVADTEGAWTTARQLGTFNVALPVQRYFTTLDVNPGWTLDPQWQFGPPTYLPGNNAPLVANTGSNIIGYNLSGNYADNLTPKYATTPPINCTGTTNLTLRFARWLRVRSSDSVAIQASTNGSTWVDVWSTSGGVADTSWQVVEHTLPAGLAGSSTLRLRWSLSANSSLNDIGWNLDDVMLFGEGTLDLAPPAASLSVATLTNAGGASHPCGVTYTDGTAVRLSSLGSGDLLVTGPNGYSNLVGFVSANQSIDTSPVTATYSILAPGGIWDASDDGAYTVMLVTGAVEDAVNNLVPGTVLGGFIVATSTATPGLLQVTPTNGLSALGPAGGPFTPAAKVYTLTNSGELPLVWSVVATEDWVGVSATDGALAPGAITNVTITVGPTAGSLSVGMYAAAVNFFNDSTGLGNTGRDVSLNVLPGFQLTVAVNNPAWGSVNPGSGNHVAGSTVPLLASPAPYYQLLEWSGDATGNANPLGVFIDTDISITANFGELLTTNHPTPHWWLAQYGYTNNLETVVTQRGANDFELWKSYIAGLNPNDPQSRFKVALRPGAAPGEFVLNWSAATGRVYSVFAGTNLLGAYAPVPGATNLALPTQSFTNPATPGGERFFRLEVQKP